MFIKVSIGEIIDKCTILEIKLEKISDKQKIKYVSKEYNYLKSIITNEIGMTLDSELYIKLKHINKNIWDLEDKIREKENNKNFDNEFIEFSRSIHKSNEFRANLKFDINLSFSSDFVEVKSYN